VKPSNSFSLGKPKANPGRGTATVPATLPGPGELAVSGKGVRASSAGAVESLKVGGPGVVKVKIKPLGKTRSRLRATGKAKVQPTIAYTPTGGDASSQKRKVRLSLRGVEWPPMKWRRGGRSPDLEDRRSAGGGFGGGGMPIPIGRMGGGGIGTIVILVIV